MTKFGVVGSVLFALALGACGPKAQNTGSNPAVGTLGPHDACQPGLVPGADGNCHDPSALGVTPVAPTDGE